MSDCINNFFPNITPSPCTKTTAVVFSGVAAVAAIVAAVAVTALFVPTLGTFLLGSLFTATLSVIITGIAGSIFLVSLAAALALRSFNLSEIEAPKANVQQAPRSVTPPKEEKSHSNLSAIGYIDRRPQVPRLQTPPSPPSLTTPTEVEMPTSPLPECYTAICQDREVLAAIDFFRTRLFSNFIKMKAKLCNDHPIEEYTLEEGRRKFVMKVSALEDSGYRIESLIICRDEDSIQITCETGLNQGIKITQAEVYGSENDDFYHTLQLLLCAAANVKNSKDWVKNMDFTTDQQLLSHLSSSEADHKIMDALRF